MARGKVTTDHDEIREFVERRGGKPAQVVRTAGGKDSGRRAGRKKAAGRSGGTRRAAR